MNKKLRARSQIRYLRKIAGCEDYWPYDFLPLDDETVSDGFGSTWSAWCPMCGRKSIHVVRPGKCQCEYCG